MLKDILEVLSRAWSEIAQLQGKAEPHRMLAQVCASRWDSRDISDGHGQNPAPSLGLVGTGDVPREVSGEVPVCVAVRFAFPRRS